MLNKLENSCNLESQKDNKDTELGLNSKCLDWVYVLQELFTNNYCKFDTS